MLNNYIWIVFYVYESAVGDYLPVLLDNVQKHNATHSNSCLANCCPTTNVLLIPMRGSQSKKEENLIVMGRI